MIRMQALGVPRDASEDDIRRAYPQARQGAASRHQPPTGTEERFKKVSSAYEILGDPEKRRAYDRGEIDGRGEPRRTASASTHAGARAGAAAGAGGGFERVRLRRHLLRHLRRGRQRAGARPNFVSAGHDVRYTLEVDFLEAVAGATKRVTLPDGGTLDLNVPAGVADGQVLRLKGKGSAAPAAAEAGDALVEIKRAAACAVQARRRRHPAGAAHHHRRGRARRQDRGADRFRPRAR